MQHQHHFGKKFYLDKKTGYWISTTIPKIRAHVWVWKNHHGEIPNAHHIHHKDHNKSNNSIDNLELILAHKHLSMHSNLQENIERSRQWAEKIRPLTKAWHSSDAGRQWHREHAKKQNFGHTNEYVLKCEQCVIEFKTYKLSGTRFCSNKCKSKFRRLSGLDDIERICVVCNKLFKVNKYNRIKTCGRKCGGVLKSKEYTGRWD